MHIFAVQREREISQLRAHFGGSWALPRWRRSVHTYTYTHTQYNARERERVGSTMDAHQLEPRDGAVSLSLSVFLQGSHVCGIRDFATYTHPQRDAMLCGSELSGISVGELRRPVSRLISCAHI